jgi:putative hemolysin
MFLEIILVFFFIIAAGILSASEIAISSFGENKIENLKENKDKSAYAFEAIQKDPNAFFGMIQIITTIFLLAAAVLTFYTLNKYVISLLLKTNVYLIEEYSNLISAIITLLLISFLITIFGSLIPKAIGFKYAERIGKFSVRFLSFLTGMFKLPVKIVTSISNFLLQPFKEKTNFYQSKLSEDEIRFIISEGVKSGAIDPAEKEIIENVFEFNDLRAIEVMVPRTEMNAVEMSDDDNKVAEEIMKTGHSLVPMYKDSLDNILGVVHTKDLIKPFLIGEKANLKSVIRPAYFVPESKLISEILKEMQNLGERLAIVTDEYGGTDGVITIEDILEEIVGELGDETGKEIKEYSKLPDGKYYVLGSMSIDDFNEAFNINLPESEEYNTIAGFIADKTGKILNLGETVKYFDLNFELIKKIRQKMVQFKVYTEDGNFSAHA